MNDAAMALGATALLGLGLRVAGLAIGDRLPPGHPFMAWAGAVSLASVAAFVVLAMLAPGGALATVPPAARIVGLLAGCAAFTATGRALPSLGVGAGALLVAQQVAG